MKQATLCSTDLSRIITATKDFVMQSIERRPMDCIRLEFDHNNQSCTAVAVDGYRMSVEHTVAADIDEDFVVYVQPNIKLPKDIRITVSLSDDGTALIQCGDVSFGYKQPPGEFFDWKKAIPPAPTFRIGFNGNFLWQALKAAKVSAGNSFKKPVVMEFRGPLDPVIIRTNDDDIKMVLPTRIKEVPKK